jgi:hypothetical protein
VGLAIVPGCVFLDCVFPDGDFPACVFPDRDFGVASRDLVAFDRFTAAFFANFADCLDVLRAIASTPESRRREKLP